MNRNPYAMPQTIEIQEMAEEHRRTLGTHDVENIADFDQGYEAGFRAAHRRTTAWQPPETAPKDRKILLMFKRTPGPQRATIGKWLDNSASDWAKWVGWTTELGPRRQELLLGWRDLPTLESFELESAGPAEG